MAGKYVVFVAPLILLATATGRMPLMPSRRIAAERHKAIDHAQPALLGGTHLVETALPSLRELELSQLLQAWASMQQGRTVFVRSC